MPRRDRVRAATEVELLETAHVLLVEGGEAALTLREVGRRMGMTASGLYRYVDGHADLVDRLVASFFGDLSRTIQAAVQAAAPAGDVAPGTAFEVGLSAGARAFRAWGLRHPAEFALMFGGGGQGRPGSPLSEAAGERFGQVFMELFARGAGVQPDQGDCVFRALPAPLDVVFARTWLRLLGWVMVEVAGQAQDLPIAADDLFDVELDDCWALVRTAVRDVRDRDDAAG